MSRLLCNVQTIKSDIRSYLYIKRCIISINICSNFKCHSDKGYRTCKRFIFTKVRDDTQVKEIELGKMSNESNGRTISEIKTEHFQQQIKLNEGIIKDLVNTDDGVWIFGYGSLVWKVNFAFSGKKIGYIKGYVRRFWQGSTDHRGTPEKPGRVVTLIPVEDKTQEVWGIAYHIPPHHLKEGLEILNFREKGGYSLTKVDFISRNPPSNVLKVLLYVAIEGNCNYVGETETDEIAFQIASAIGPSGANKDYLFNLAEILRKNNMSTRDDEMHTMELERKVREILENNA